MNRNREYWDLIARLGDPPAGLEGTVDRARARVKRARRGRHLGIPMASLAGAAAAFVLLVNVSVPFARACQDIPILGALAQAVALSPSLRAAVEHNYIQDVAQSQSAGGVTMTVEHLIVDQSHLHVFYTLSSPGSTLLEAAPQLLDGQGERLEGYVATWGEPIRPEEGEYQLASFLFVDETVPDRVSLRFDISDTGRAKNPGEVLSAPMPAPTAHASWPDGAPYEAPPTLVSFTFDLTIDPTLLGPGRTVEVDRWVEIDGQRVLVESLSIDPTRMEFTLREDPENTARLEGLICYAEDGLGSRYGRPSVTYGGGDKIQLESSYFSDSRELTLFITGARWLDKDRPSFQLDLTDGTADWLPEGFAVETVERGEQNVYLAFRNDRQAVLFDAWYCDPEGGRHEWGGGSFSSTDEDGDGICEKGVEYLVLRDYPWDTVTIPMSASRLETYDEPIRVPIQ